VTNDTWCARVLLGLALVTCACATLQNVSPADRAKAYDTAAASARAECKAYAFDRATELVPDVPSMTALCAGQ